jgi:tetratricopeptide (TPR) repeat protein
MNVAWNEIKNHAEKVKKLCTIDDIDEQFNLLFDTYENDPMIYYIKAEACKNLEKIEMACENFKMAANLFPQSVWREKAQKLAAKVCHEP